MNLTANQMVKLTANLTVNLTANLTVNLMINHGKQANTHEARGELRSANSSQIPRNLESGYVKSLIKLFYLDL